MSGVHLHPVAFLALGLPILGLHLFSVMLTKALRAYSRSRLEEVCARKGRAGRAAEVAHHDESTERASEILAVITGLMLAALLGIGADRLAPSLAVELILAIALMVGALGYVLAGVAGQVFAERLLDSVWPTAGTIRLALRPLAWAVREVERIAERLADPRDLAPRPTSVEVEIPTDETEAGEIDADLPESTRELMWHAVMLTHRDVSELMTPRSRVVWMRAEVSAAEAARIFRETGKSRVPLYGENHDDIVGILYAKDLFPLMADPTTRPRVVPRDLVRRPYCIPSTKNAFELLEEFRSRRTQIAIVLDEYGGVTGVVTLEDLLEELVGNIDDEHDAPTPDDPVVPLGGSRYEVEAGVRVEDLNERLGLRLPTDEDYTTVGGLAFTTLGRVPEPGATFRAGGVEFRVVEVAEHAIRKLALEVSPPAAVGS